ncbi:uncharacterized protein LOC127749008 [Frankliniella occidentalis]|uniref:Uncharacterized protein LOC127749008 n=1 Tax=Frankliniella occidentalis TaxID=133901 RepID=A0A9C6U419_FRAOC|nr:uncharacterized protein LOC127749008 [Frankliniella occidentalis]
MRVTSVALPVGIFNAMRGCKYYCLLGCADAFMQLKLDEKSQEILVRNTCIGLLKPTRLPYALASACFESAKDQVLALSRLEKHKVRVRYELMKLHQTDIEIFGYVLGHNIYKPSKKKVTAIVNCAVLKNPSEVQTYMLCGPGMRDMRKLFELSKEMKLKSKALAVYDPSKELVLISDASPVRVGAQIHERLRDISFNF